MWFCSEHARHKELYNFWKSQQKQPKRIQSCHEVRENAVAAYIPNNDKPNLNSRVSVDVVVKKQVEQHIPLVSLAWKYRQLTIQFEREKYITMLHMALVVDLSTFLRLL